MTSASYPATLYIKRNHEEEEEEGWFPYDFLGVSVTPDLPTHNMVEWVDDMVNGIGLKEVLEDVAKELGTLPFTGAEILAVDGRLWSQSSSSRFYANDSSSRFYTNDDDYEDGFEAEMVRLPRRPLLVCPECRISYEDPTPVCLGCAWATPVPHDDLPLVQGPVWLEYPHGNYAETRVFDHETTGALSPPAIEVVGVPVKDDNAHLCAERCGHAQYGEPHTVPASPETRKLLDWLLGNKPVAKP